MGVHTYTTCLKLCYTIKSRFKMLREYLSWLEIMSLVIALLGKEVRSPFHFAGTENVGQVLSHSKVYHLCDIPASQDRFCADYQSSQWEEHLSCVSKQIFHE